MMVVVTEVVLVPVDALAGLSMSPANTDIASNRLRIIAAHIRHKVFIWLLLSMRYKILVAYKILVSTLEQP